MTKKTFLKKALSVLTAVTIASAFTTGIPFGKLGLGITASAADIVASGNCGAVGDGSNITWTLDSEGTLTISGTGAMADYTTTADVPWFSYMSNITKIVINSGVTTIGANAFLNCTGLTTVNVPCNWNTENPLYAFTNTVTVNIGEHNNTYSASGAVISAKCSVCKGTGKATVSSQGGTYDGTTAFGATVTGTGTLASMSVDIEYFRGDTSFGNSAPINAGTYTAKIICGEKTASVEYTIAKATPTAEMFNYSAPANLVYDGTEKSASVSTDKVGMGEITVKYYQNNKQVTPKNVGTYTVKIDVAEGDNYTAVKGFEVGTFEITKGTPTVTAPTANENLIYTGKAQKLVSAGATTDGTIQYSLEENGTYSTVIPTGTNAGAYTVYYKVVGDSNVNDVEAQSVNVTIAKVPLTITAKSYTIKTGTALPSYDYTVAGLVNNDTLPVDVTISCSAADSSATGNYDITVSGAVTSENYNITYIDSTLTITDKEIQTITAKDITLTYGAEPITLNAATTGDGTITYRLITSNGSITLDGNNKVTLNKAGTATIEVTASETENYAKAVKTISITINKAAVTITAKSHTVKKGDAMPALTYTVTGLVNGDTLAGTPVITCAAADTNTTGSFNIVLNYPKSEDEKYTYTIKNGKLTVGNNSSSSGGGYSGGGGGGGSSYKPEPPMIDGKSTSWGSVADKISDLLSGETLTIDLNGNIDIPVSVLRAIAESGAKVTFILKENLSCTIDGTKLDGDITKDFDIYSSSVNTNSLRGEAAAKFHIGGEKIPVEITVTVDKKHAGKFANLHKRKENDFVFVDNVRVDENGKMTVLITEAGEYAIMLGGFSDRPGDLSNDGRITADDSTAILKEITALAKSVNPEVADYNGDGRVNALDASAILIDIKNGRI